MRVALRQCHPIFLCSYLAACIFMLGAGAQGGQPVCKVVFKDGSSYRAEILKVRDSSLILTRYLDTQDDELRRDPSKMILVRLVDINRIEVGGERHAVLGMLLGFATGSLTGGIIGASSWQSKERDAISTAVDNGLGKTAATLGGILVGGLCGLTLGFIVGGNVVTDKEEIDPTISSDLARLVGISRYALYEPTFLIPGY